MTESILDRLFPVIFRVLARIEVANARLITFMVTRELRRLKRLGVIRDYAAKTKRLGKLHYRSEVEVDLSSRQYGEIIQGLAVGTVQALRRWLND